MIFAWRRAAIEVAFHYSLQQSDLEVIFGHEMGLELCNIYGYLIGDTPKIHFHAESCETPNL